MISAVIPARGGSKRIPRKNLFDLAGRPMIAHVIATVTRAGCFDTIVVSTDDEEIAEVAREHGASVPGLRNAAIADDYTPLATVIQHALTDFSLQGDWVAQIYATAVLLRPETLLRAADVAARCDADTDFVIGLAAFPHPIQRAVSLTSDMDVMMLDPRNATTRTQDLPQRYFDAGQFVFGRHEAWRKGRSVWDSKTKGIVLARDEAVDIDEPGDLDLIEALIQARTHRESA